MSNKTTHILLIAMIVVCVVFGVYLYPRFPSEVASHWDAGGNANGYMSKFWGIFLTPIIMLAMFMIYTLVPRIDPMSKNITEFRGVFNKFWVLLFAFFAYVFGIILFWNLGFLFNFAFAIAPALGIMFYFIGGFMQSAKRNFFFGVRTPWTLSSDVVWDKTHKLAGILFKITGALTILSVFLGGVATFATFISCIVVSTFASIIYSYVEFKKLK